MTAVMAGALCALTTPAAAAKPNKTLAAITLFAGFTRLSKAEGTISPRAILHGHICQLRVR